MAIKQIRVVYDDEFDIPLPTPLLSQLEVPNYDISSISMLMSPFPLNYGAGPIFASILVIIQTEVWGKVVERVVGGLIELVRNKWFEQASDKAQETEKALLQKSPTNDYARARQKMLSLSSNTNMSDDDFPYSLMNISISESGRRWIQVLFPYPITNVQAEQAILALQKILENIEISSSGMMIFDKNSGDWIIKGPIKLSESL